MEAVLLLIRKSTELFDMLKAHNHYANVSVVPIGSRLNVRCLITLPAKEETLVPQI